MDASKTLPLFFLNLLLPMMVAAQAPDAVGSILLTRGTVTALDNNGATRNLSRRSEIFTGDRISTGDPGFTQIRMIDGAIIALQENTEFTLHEYTFDGVGSNPDKARLELHQGSFRTIDGGIGDEESDEYLLITPAMDVVPRGTTYECVIENNKTVCGVYDGGITVSNAAGAVKLGLGGDWDYAESDNRQGPITPLLNRPAVLGSNGQTSALNNTVQVQPTPNAVTPLTNGITFPAPTPIRVVPYRNPR